MALRYELTGCVAHSRISPLLPDDAWTDVNDDADADADTDHDDAANEQDKQPPHFLWENAQRRYTRPYRDFVKCYSHLPNGTAILDSKWVLARLLGSSERSDATATAAGPAGSTDKSALATLESHCFRGISGFGSFLELIAKEDPKKRILSAQHYDLLDETPRLSTDEVVKEDYPGLWVVKDADSNGAGGIWVVGSENYKEFSDKALSPLSEEHRYVAQRYTWPMVLYNKRKCHVRVYGLITSDGRAFVHRRAFLHVANDPFVVSGDEPTNDEAYQTSVHITNCCANSHDVSKFAGEIVADLERVESPEENGETDGVPLGKFWGSICASVAELARRTRPFLQGGEVNGGFEYLGMDFILSYKEDGTPVAYLLEVNAPPSQDTATGLPFAEDVHDTVMRDLLSLWVFPKATGVAEDAGGWRCVYEYTDKDHDSPSNTKLISPSKAVLLNKILWALYEKKRAKQQEKAYRQQLNAIASAAESAELVATHARTYFPFYNDRRAKASQSQPCAFFENAGGSQVPRQVIDAVCSSLGERNRSVIGYESRATAKDVLRTILGATQCNIFLGSNASSLLSGLAAKYVRSGFLKESDEIVIHSENHLANVTPWLQAASAVGASIKWWNSSAPVQDVVGPRTRLVLVPHASNILGRLYDLPSIRKAVDEAVGGVAHIIVDGVAAAPHWFADVDELNVDWYVVSCHKLFGPHLGALCGRLSATEEILRSGGGDNELEIGTVSYEACAGVYGLGNYFAQLSTMYGRSEEQRAAADESCRLTTARVKETYRLIRVVERPLVDLLLKGLRRSTKVRIIENVNRLALRLPVVSFVHADIPSTSIAETCTNSGVACRSGSFLCTEPLRKEYEFDATDGVVRFSLAHYNTLSEVHYAVGLLESLPGWY